MSAADDVQPTIGSDFASPKAPWLQTSVTNVPWAGPSERVEYVQTGRQALALIAEQLESESVRTIAVPEYLCDSMLEPFVARSWSIFPVPINDQLELEPEAVEEVTTRAPQRLALLSASYFGACPNAGLTEVINSVDPDKVIAIEDETHRPFTPGGTASRWSFSSLRKVLPVADGAYIRHSGAPMTMHLSAVTTEPSRWGPMDAQSSLMATADRSELRVQFLAANTALEDLVEPRRITDRSLTTLLHLDYGALANRRRENAAVVVAAIEDSGVVPLRLSRGREVPSHLVVRVSHARGLQEHLAMHGVFCPVHWPKSEVLQLKSPWRTDLLSIPIDHRYSAADMTRVGEAIRSWRP